MFIIRYLGVKGGFTFFSPKFWGKPPREKFARKIKIPASLLSALVYLRTSREKILSINALLAEKKYF